MIMKDNSLAKLSEIEVKGKEKIMSVADGEEASIEQVGKEFSKYSKMVVEQESKVKVPNTIMKNGFDCLD